MRFLTDYSKSSGNCMTSNGFPADYTAASMMAAISVAIGNSHRVEVKRNLHESTILYIAIVGRPGACKSHPLAFAMQPLVNADWKNTRKNIVSTNRR